ncbi:MAG TPA: FtsW/RodA/SpoVE family cell cycle protein [Ruania sp.]|nr:FtsW/RodA/SpoVE family cell cycle protein [Ruania sp.]
MSALTAPTRGNRRTAPRRNRPTGPTRSRRTRPAARKQRRAPWAQSAAWQSPVTTYYLIGGVTILLLVLGLVMVLSSSSIYALSATEGSNPFADFVGQASYALIAVPVAYLMSRLPVRVYRALAWPAMVGTLALQVLVFTPLVLADGGNANWVAIGPIVMQPSEFAKFGLALWLGAVLATKGKLLAHWSHVLFPALLVAALFLATVLYSHDLGTALVFIALVAGALWVAGVPMSKFVVAGCAVVALVAALAVSSASRTRRILDFLGMGAETDAHDTGYQSVHALWGLGSGGLSGVGLGASKEKWLWLPAGDNDFIFAIIGEELGLLGALLVLGLFIAMAVGMCRLIARHPDPFVKITTAAVGCWILGQAMINIGVAIGLLPVIGLPLPLVSKGGSSLVTTIAALAMVLAFARDEPGAKEALAVRRGSMRRSLAVISGRAGAGRGRG